MNRITAIIVISSALTAHAAIPLRWVVDVRSAAPATFEAFQGETIELTALLHAAGKPLAAPAQYSIYWQTNGMGSTYWSAPCTPLGDGTNAMVAVWRPDYDVGARAYNCFIGAPSNIYHAAFQLRLRPSPGARPNELPLPTPTIDCSIVTFLHPEDAPFSGGGGGGITAQDATNAAAAVVERDVPEWAKAAEPPQTGIDASTATNIAEVVVTERLPPSRATWNRDGFWEIRYEVQPAQSVYADYTLTTNSNYQVISNATSGITYGMIARCSQAIIDEYAHDVAPVSEWTCLTPGATIDADGILTASASGSYRVRARSASDIRYCDVPLSQHRHETRTLSTYIADATSLRRAVNDDALAALTAAVFASSNQHAGVWYNEYTTPTYSMTQPGAGNVMPFAISEHVLISAQHYPAWNRYTGAQSFDDGAGHASTVNKLAWIDLRSWALTNGWTEIELAEMTDCADIAFIICDDSAAVPDGCIPWVMTEETRRLHFGDSLCGVQAWETPQASTRANPVTMTSNSSWTYDGYYRDYARADIVPERDRMGQLVWAYSGDSGKPVYIVVDGKPVIVSSHHTASGGPDICRALPVIRAFVEAHGDTLKEVE